MRLFLLPISTRRSLIYCEKLHDKAASERSWLDRITTKANETWVAWEKDDKAVGNWKMKVTFYGNQALKRIPYEEWGLKTIPALTAKRKAAIVEGREKYQVIFPGLYLHRDKVPAILRQLATERQLTHRSKMMWSIVAMPFTAPFMLVPVVPNLPFFYCVYRAWSHWKALSGARHLEFLLAHNLPHPNPAAELDQVYSAGLMYPTRQVSRAAPRPTQEQAEAVSSMVEQQTKGGAEDVMVLQRWNGKLIAEQFELPDMEIEIERAVEQVEQSIKAKEQLQKEKLELEQAAAAPRQTAKEELPVHVQEHLDDTERRIHEGAERVAKSSRPQQNDARRA